MCIASRHSVRPKICSLWVLAFGALLIACSGPGTDLGTPQRSPPPAATIVRAPTVAPTARNTIPGSDVAPLGTPTPTVPAPTPAGTTIIPSVPIIPRATGSSVAATQPPTAPSAPTAPSVQPSTGPLQPDYRIAFVSNGAMGDDIWMMDSEGRRLVDVTKAQKTKGGNDSDPQWSPDGKRIAFVSDRDGNADIWVMNADGSGARNLTRAPGDDVNPRWSPDGKRIAFVSFRDKDGEIYVMSADGSEQTNLTKSDGDDLQPAWSPDGTQIAFVSERGKRPRALYSLSVESPKSPFKIAAPNCDITNPVWSPDGKTLALASCPGADGQANPDATQHVVYTVPSGGGSLTPVSDPKMDSGGPVYSPDGKALAFWSYRTPQQADIVVATPGSGARRVVPAPPGVGREPAWSADSASLAFVGGDFTIGNVIVADPGGLTHNVTNHPANDRSPRWSPQKMP